MANAKVDAVLSATPQDLWGKVYAFVEAAKVAAKDGLTLGEFAQLSVSLVSLSADALESLPVEGAEKKKWVQDAVGLLFDGVADKVVPIYLYPIWVLTRSSVRSLVIAVAGGAVEAILPLLRA